MQVVSVRCAQLSQKGRFLRGRQGGERIAAERSESASQNSFLIPTSQKVAAYVSFERCRSQDI